MIRVESISTISIAFIQKEEVPDMALAGKLSAKSAGPFSKLV